MTYPPDPQRLIQPGTAEETLRLIANLRAPDDLAVRVQAELLQADLSTPAHAAKLLSWPWALGSSGSVLRGAAAAAIVCVVAGGGWQIYTSIPASVAPRMVQMPGSANGPGGFGAANARRVPETLVGPVITQRPPANANPTEIEPAKAGPQALPVAPTAAGTHKKHAHRGVAAPVR